MHSEFRLTTALRHERTKVDDLYFNAPFKLVHPFVDGRHTEFMLSFVGPGFLAGDEARMDCVFGPGTDSTISTQSYEKVLDTAGGSASRIINLTVQGIAKTVFLPLPVIPFQNSDFENAVTAHISPQSTFVYADVVANGRAGMGEQWKMQRYSSKLKVFVDGTSFSEPDETPHVSATDAPSTARHRTCPTDSTSHLAFADHTLLEPGRFDYSHMAMWRDYTHNGLMYIHLPEPSCNGMEKNGATTLSLTERNTARANQEDALIAKLRDLAKSMRLPGEFGTTRVMDGVVARLLTSRGSDALDFITAASRLVD